MGAWNRQGEEYRDWEPGTDRVMEYREWEPGNRQGEGI